MTCFKLENGETLRSYCLRTKINYHAIYSRLESGMSIEDSINDYILKKKKNIKGHSKYFYNGTTLREYINNDPKYQRICFLLRKNFTIEQALLMEEEKQKKRIKQYRC